MGKPTPRIPCHLWEPFNHVGHAFRRGDQTVHCPGRNRAGMPWVSPKPSRAGRRAAVMAEWHAIWAAEQVERDRALMA